MTCQEVIEYMQRQLDDDLGEHEYEILMEHTRHCPDCAAMFERLKKLSEELGNLPHVMPQYSLVDAILPQLEQIVPFRQPEAAAVEIPPVTPQATRRTKERHQLRFRAITGIIAASVAAGLFIVSYNAGLFPSSNNFANDSKAETAAASDIAADQMAPQQKMMDAQLFSNDGGKAQVNTESVDPNSSGTSNRSTDDDSHVTTEEDLNISQSDFGESTSNSGNSAGGSEGAVSGEKSGEKGSSSVTGTAPSIAAGGEDSNGPVQGFTEAPMPLQTTSPDGSYVAKASSFVIHVYTTGDNASVYESERRNGKITTLVWSEDSKQLTYEIQLESGGMERYVIDMESLTESKAVH